MLFAIGTCLLLGLVGSTVLLAYALQFEISAEQFGFLWLACTLFFFTFGVINGQAFAPWAQLCLIVILAALSGFFAEAVHLHVFGWTGAIVGSILGVGVALEGLILGTKNRRDPDRHNKLLDRTGKQSDH